MSRHQMTTARHITYGNSNSEEPTSPSELYSIIKTRMPTFRETLTLDATFTGGELSPIHIALEHRISNQFEIYQLLITSEAV